jgi:hypothetical protein
VCSESPWTLAGEHSLWECSQPVRSLAFRDDLLLVASLGMAYILEGEGGQVNDGKKNIERFYRIRKESYLDKKGSTHAFHGTGPRRTEISAVYWVSNQGAYMRACVRSVVPNEKS